MRAEVVEIARINAKWSLGYDDLQWILRRYKGIDKRDGSDVWENVSFVTYSKAALTRCMREKMGLKWNEALPAEVENLLSILPSNFPEFKAQRMAAWGVGNRVDGVVGSQVAEKGQNASGPME